MGPLFSPRASGRAKICGACDAAARSARNVIREVTTLGTAATVRTDRLKDDGSSLGPKIDGQPNSPGGRIHLMMTKFRKGFIMTNVRVCRHYGYTYELFARFE